MRSNRLRAAAKSVGVMSLAVALAACGSSSGGTAAGGGKRVKLAVEYGALSFPYHSALKLLVHAKAKELGGVSIIEGDSNNDTGTELANVQNLLSQNPDCMLLIPVGNASSAPAEAAQGANVPVVSFDQKAAGPAKAFVGYNQLQSGDLLGQFIVDQYKALNKPKIKVIYIRGIIGHVADTARNQGLKATLQKAGLDKDKVGIIEQSADFDRAKAESITNNLMRQHPDTDIIVANNDDMLLGAYSATQTLKLPTGPGTPLHLAGVDGVPEALKLIGEGKIDATMFQDPVAEANTAVTTCVAAAKGEAVSDTVLSFRQVTKADAAAALDSVKSLYK
ncbi:sugar ABC transporter substrate-binding protein [Planosporangium flavigriseum]|uniref:D-ribose ABC transporter substrate-binding protein n=1 Tax=Planosporangium flavigriseum TaxID=373681 RepID=A0A8J3PQ08_9ACTN|nr:sugar ABC transporter substrate-binding protein [Planosporangium flavigriseum]NJC67469.1 sugar ABC transporter substrate-binding protein [Planosporangium flavigriseum]GIG75581.1 D-ribose ABC transporter substrate-binding protein [Planosporangium flavigriseum]